MTSASNSSTANTTIVKGAAALELARQGIPVNKYADPTEGARTGIDADEAEEIAREDVGLLWVAR